MPFRSRFVRLQSQLLSNGWAAFLQPLISSCHVPLAAHTATLCGSRKALAGHLSAACRLMTHYAYTTVLRPTLANAHTLRHLHFPWLSHTDTGTDPFLLPPSLLPPPSSQARAVEQRLGERPAPTRGAATSSLLSTAGSCSNGSHEFTRSALVQSARQARRNQKQEPGGGKTP